jgi:hypothetical protein
MARYKNYELLLVHPSGNTTNMGVDFFGEALRYFQNHPTAVKMIVFKATHNNTRLEKHSDYGPDEKRK